MWDERACCNRRRMYECPPTKASRNREISPRLGLAMRPWIIVLSSALLALVTVGVLIRPELIMTPHSAILPSMLPLLPTLVVTGLAVYALFAILLTSGNLIVEAFGVRRHLIRNPPHHGPAQPDWTAAFSRSELRQLVPAPAAVQPRPAPVDGTIVLQGRFQPREARREVGRLFYIRAARAHFFSALIVLTAGVVLGAAQAHAPLPFLPGPIPTIPAALAVAGLVLLAVLSRIAVDVAAEPLIEIIERMPAEPTETGLLRRTIELLKTPSAIQSPRDSSTPAPAVQIPERLSTVLEQGHRALFDAIERLSKTTDGLATTTRSSIEALEATFRATELRQQTMAQNAVVDTVAMTDLRDAVAALTAVLEGVRDAPTPAEGEPGTALSRQRQQPDLALELRKLLQEIGTAP